MVQPLYVLCNLYSHFHDVFDIHGGLKNISRHQRPEVVAQGEPEATEEVINQLMGLPTFKVTKQQQIIQYWTTLLHFTTLYNTLIDVLEPSETHRSRLPPKMGHPLEGFQVFSH